MPDTYFITIRLSCNNSTPKISDFVQFGASMPAWGHIVPRNLLAGILSMALHLQGGLVPYGQVRANCGQVTPTRAKGQS